MEISIAPCKVNDAPYELFLLADEDEEMLARYLTKGECFAARDEERIIGVMILLDTRPLTVEIMNIAVDPQFQNKGIGKQLVTHAVSRARSRGMKTIDIRTGNCGIGQLALYQKCGFRIVGVDRDYIAKNYPREIVENGIVCRDMILLSMELE